jgi:hypothetical protein
MAAYLYPKKPGTEYGPCADECQHIDCAKSRSDAASKCRICNEPIGYGNEIYFEKSSLVHATCLWRELDRDTETSAPHKRVRQTRIRS